ncbi:hypothetical protein S40288_08000 [Stachybotrys chartarum IBT 40288]|nr:hypothetical protein S40288_08000 [Stachybotrys chartarum IBT 40288]
MPQPSQPTLLNSYEECINVIIDNCQREQPADATYCPDFPPEETYGTAFEPLEMPYREPRFLPLPPTALELIQTFIPEALVACWVDYTNKAADVAGVRDWHPTSLPEIYLWLAMLIHMGTPRESAFRDYWKASTAGGYYPTHPITKLMPSRRFEQLRIRIRICSLAHTTTHNHDAFDCADECVVPFLVEKLPSARYHVFVDNLFSSPQLFDELRNEGHGATGTARTNCGIFKQLVEAKIRDKQGKCWQWNELRAYATVNNKVNQIGWKDNALVLLLSTVFTGEEFERCIRRRPTSTAKTANPIKEAFGDEAVKEMWAINFKLQRVSSIVFVRAVGRQ